MAEKAQKKAKGSRKNRKFGRNKKKCEKYFQKHGKFGVKSRSKRWQ